MCNVGKYYFMFNREFETLSNYNTCTVHDREIVTDRILISCNVGILLSNKMPTDTLKGSEYRGLERLIARMCRGKIGMGDLFVGLITVS